MTYPALTITSLLAHSGRKKKLSYKSFKYDVEMDAFRFNGSVSKKFAAHYGVIHTMNVVFIPLTVSLGANIINRQRTAIKDAIALAKCFSEQIDRDIIADALDPALKANIPFLYKDLEAQYNEMFTGNCPDIILGSIAGHRKQYHITDVIPYRDIRGGSIESYYGSATAMTPRLKKEVLDDLWDDFLNGNLELALDAGLKIASIVLNNNHMEQRFANMVLLHGEWDDPLTGNNFVKLSNKVILCMDDDGDIMLFSLHSKIAVTSQPVMWYPRGTPISMNSLSKKKGKPKNLPEYSGKFYYESIHLSKFSKI